MYSRKNNTAVQKQESLIVFVIWNVFVAGETNIWLGTVLSLVLNNTVPWVAL